jgi:hypothetical protein
VPLANNVITCLSKIAESVSSKEHLQSGDEDMIKEIFKNILEGGHSFEIKEIEDWFSLGSWNDKLVDRIINIAHYQQAKYDSNNKLKFISESCSCGKS